MFLILASHIYPVTMNITSSLLCLIVLGYHIMNQNILRHSSMLSFVTSVIRTHSHPPHCHLLPCCVTLW